MLRSTNRKARYSETQTENLLSYLIYMELLKGAATK